MRQTAAYDAMSAVPPAVQNAVHAQGPNEALFCDMGISGAGRRARALAGGSAGGAAPGAGDEK